MIAYLVALIVINALVIVVLPTTVGKERKPLTTRQVAAHSAISTALIVFATVALLRGWSA